jgi:hypothetical protein
MNQHNGLSGTMVFIIEMDGSGILFSDFNVDIVCLLAIRGKKFG